MEGLEEKTKGALLRFLEDRFGLTDLEGFSFFALGKGRIHLATREAAALAFQPPAVVAGLPCARLSDSGAFKPASMLLQLFGPRITKSRVDLSPEQAKEFIAGRDIALQAEATDGFVAACSRGQVLGCGLLKAGMLKSQVPRAKRIG